MGKPEDDPRFPALVNQFMTINKRLNRKAAIERARMVILRRRAGRDKPARSKATANAEA